MAQRPTADFNIDPNITSGTDLANILNRFQDAIDSGNSGASRPAYLAAGGLWVREGDPMRLYLYDGTTDRELYNTTDGIVGALEDGTVDGQITTWNASSGEWTPEGAVVVDAGGRVGIGVDTVNGVPLAIGNGPLFIYDSVAPYTRHIYTGNVPAGGHIGDVQFYQEGGNNPGVSSLISGLDENGSNAGALAFSTGATPPAVSERMRIDASGRVGIGTDSPAQALHINHTDGLAVQIDRGGDKAFLYHGASGGEDFTVHNQSGGIRLFTELGSGGAITAHTEGTERFRIDEQGRVGIGGAPSRSTKEIEEEAEATLRNWDSKDKKPTKAELIKQLAERNIGGGTAKLQVAGDGYFSGAVSTAAVNDCRSILNGVSGGIVLSGQAGAPYVLYPSGPNGNPTNGENDFGQASTPWRNGYFSGAVYANGSPLTRVGDIIETFRTLKNAVSDETTVEGIKEALTNSLGGLIEKFEAMQSAATQEIES